MSALLGQPAGLTVDFVAVVLVAGAVLAVLDGAEADAVTAVETELTGTDAWLAGVLVGTTDSDTGGATVGELALVHPARPRAATARAARIDFNRRPGVAPAFN